jgi:hypothetical protein
MLFGSFNIDDSWEEGRILKTPSEVIFHDDYSSNSFHEDIAILMMEQEINFTDLIRPICLWNSSPEPTVNEGIVTSWSNSTNSLESSVKMQKVSIDESNENCGNSQELSESNKVFCAGKVGLGACSTDTGNGFYIEVNGIYFFKGIVSSLIDSPNCFTKSFAIYTNVIKYFDWIENPKGLMETCGIMSASAGLVQGGKVSTREQFPWVVAISKKVLGKFEHRGTGSLITHSHVLSTAFPVSYWGKPGAPYRAAQNKYIRLYLGTTTFNNGKEPGTIFVDGAKGISKTVLYPGARSADISYKLPDIGDVAVIFLKNPITFTEFISPVCMWKFDTKIADQAGQVAYAVGYGEDASETFTGIRKHVAMKIMEISECKKNYGKFFENAQQSEYFCAQGDENNFAYLNDQPLYMKVNDKWHLRGLLTLVIKSNQTTIYESQSRKFVEWITNVIQS